MTDKRTAFRLFVLGKLVATEQPQTLTTVAEFTESRAVRHIQLTVAESNDLNQRIRDLRGFIEAGYPPLEEPSLKQLGGMLFETFIRDEVKSLFDIATGRQEAFLPLEILAEDNNIAGWPWEYLYDPAKQLFVCQEFHPISRSVFALIPKIRVPAKDGKVRILLLIGVPPDDPNTTPKEEIKWVQEVFNAELARQSAEIKVMEAINPRDLESELQAHRCDVVHFFGHAGFDLERQEGYLRFDRPNTQPFHFYANEFGQLLAGQGIRLVFLNACETARSSQNEDAARSSVAAALLGRGIPAVIATQFSIPDTSAHFLSSVIYNALVTGKPLVEAMRDGRRAMAYAEKHQFSDWGIPVLYSYDPELVVFPRPTGSRPTKWMSNFEASLKKKNVAKSLSVPQARGGPSITVERTAQPPRKKSARVRVALIDIDSKVGFLPDLVEAANQAQTYYQFKVVYLPIPSGAVRTDLMDDGAKSPPHLFLPRLEATLSNTPQDLKVHLVCCLTRHLIANVEDGDLTQWYFTGVLNSNPNVAIVSTYGLRGYAKQARVTFAKATLFLCLAQLVETQSEKIEFHEETAGCLFDYCKNRDDVVVGLKHMRFDHAPCRKQVTSREQLKAIDALLALELKESE